MRNPRSDCAFGRRRRGFATLMVFGVIVFGALALSMVQTASFGQASAGREALARVRAEWAARAGVEETLARLEGFVEEDDGGDAFLGLERMAEASDGELMGATWRVRSTEGQRELFGPEDAGAKLNVNRMTREQLLELEPFMSEDVADSILDWIDSDDDTRELGAEIGYYKSLPYTNEPRNGPLRSIAELELIAGVDPSDVRGEDWNLNGLLDSNEDDGDLSWPPDNADGLLDRGWSGVLTVMSVENPRGRSGEERLDLTAADDGDVRTRLAISQQQAQAITDWVQVMGGQSLTDFIRNPLGRMAQTMARRQGKSGQEVRQAGRTPALSREQLRALVDECSIGPAELQSYLPGRLNVNTCAAETLDFLPEVEPDLSDAIIAERSGRAEGFESVVDLLDVPGMTNATLASIADLLTTRSNVYVVCSRGRDERTGLEVEIVATLDASTLPAVVREVRVR